MLTFRFFGADGVMTVPEKITTGMVGKEVRFEFSSDWDGLDKTAVFSAGDVSVPVHAVGEIVKIPPEVLLVPMQRFYIGIYGELKDGTLIIPTIYAKGPRIERGADPYGGTAGDPPLPKWQELENRIDQLEKSGGAGGLSQPLRVAIYNLLMAAAYTSTGHESDKAALAELLTGGDTGSGDDGGETEAILSSISATYNGGDVTVGTAVDSLTGIVVTAHYSDGSSETVTGYTLIGEIVEGSNTITVSYGGKTTTITVNGVAESVEENLNPIVTGNCTIQTSAITEGATPSSVYLLVLPTSGNISITDKTMYVPVVPTDHADKYALTVEYTATADCYAVAWSVSENGYSVIQK